MGALAHIAQAHACAEDQLLITPRVFIFSHCRPRPRPRSVIRQTDRQPPRPEPDAILILRTQYMSF